MAVNAAIPSLSGQGRGPLHKRCNSGYLTGTQEHFGNDYLGDCFLNCCKSVRNSEIS